MKDDYPAWCAVWTPKGEALPVGPRGARTRAF